MTLLGPRFHSRLTHSRPRLVREESAEDEEDGQQAQLRLSGNGSGVRSGRPDGDRGQQAGRHRGAPREGDLDVLSAATTATGRVQSTGRSRSELQRRAQIDSCWCNIPDMFVDPASRAAYYWMALVTVAVIYNWIVIILRVAFEDTRDSDVAQKVFRVLDVVCDAIYLMDVAIQSRTAYLEDGCLVKSLPETMRHYRSQPRFVLDVLSVMPLSTVLCVLSRIWPLSLMPSFSDSASAPAMRFLRLLKYPSMIRFFEKTDSHTNNPNLLRAFKLSLHLWLVIHWTGCFYYLISRYEGLGINDWVYPNSTDYTPFRRKYIFCMYWSTMTLTTIGERPWPATDLEYVFTGMTFLVGVFVFAAVVGNVGDVISNMNAARHDFQARMDQIKFYLNHRHVPEHLQDQIKRWAEYTWARTKAIDEHSMLQLLPNRLRTEVAIHVHLQTLKKVRIFEQCEEALLRELVLKLRPSIYSPGEYICRIGEIGREMYIIDHGKVEILFPDRQTGQKKQVAIMMPGNYFGEISLLKLDEGQNKRTADVRSIGFSELLCLSRRDLLSALMEYPEAKKILEAQARQRMQQTKWTPSEPRPSPTEETGSAIRASGPARRSARAIFAEVMKQEGFSKLLSSKANQELTEMREILRELKDIKSHLSETSIKQLAKQCQSVEQQLEEKERELQETRSQLLLERRMVSAPSTMASNLTLISTCSLTTDTVPCSESTFSSVSTAQRTSTSQSPASLPAKPKRPFNAVMVLPPFDPLVAATHRRRRLSPSPRARQSVKEDRAQPASGELPQDVVGAVLNSSLGDGGGDELAVSKDQPDKEQKGEEEGCSGKTRAPSKTSSSESTGRGNRYRCAHHKASTERPASTESDSSFEIINWSSVESSPEQPPSTRGRASGRPGKSGEQSPSDSSESSNSLASTSDTSNTSGSETASSSSTTNSSGGRGGDPKPARPRPRYKRQDSKENDAPAAGDSPDARSTLRQSAEKKSCGTESLPEKKQKPTEIETCATSEWSSPGSDSHNVESEVSSSTGTQETPQREQPTPSTRTLPNQYQQQTASGDESALNRDKTVSLLESTQEDSPYERSPDAASSPRDPWDDPAMLEAAGISAEHIAYLDVEREDQHNDCSGSNDDDDDDSTVIPATRVRSDFDKSVPKEASPKTVTCRKIDDSQLSILLAKRREVNDSPDNIVESVRRADPTCNVGTGRLLDADHSHSVHSVLESPDMQDEKGQDECESERSKNGPSKDKDVTSQRSDVSDSEQSNTTYEHFLLSCGKRSRYSKVEFSFSKPLADSEKEMLSVMECAIAEQILGDKDTVPVPAQRSHASQAVAQCPEVESPTSPDQQMAVWNGDTDKASDEKGSSKPPSTAPRVSEEHDKKYPVSILKKPKSDTPPERTAQDPSPEPINLSSPGKPSWHLQTSVASPERETSTPLQPKDGPVDPLDPHVMRDSESELSAVEYDSSCLTGDTKLMASKKSKRSRNRNVELQLGLFPLCLRNEAKQPPPVEVATAEQVAVTDAVEKQRFQEDETHAEPLQESMQQSFQDDNEEDSLPMLRRKYSASRYRRLSIDKPIEIIDGSQLEVHSLSPKRSPARKESSSPPGTECLAMIATGGPSPNRKYSEKLDSLIATFDSPKKKYIREDFLISCPKNSTAPAPETPESKEAAEVKSSCESSGDDPPTVDQTVGLKEDGRESSSSLASTPTNSPPQKRKTLRRRSLTKRLSNPYSRKEGPRGEKNKASSPSKDFPLPGAKEDGKEAAFQQPPGEGPPATSPEKKKDLVAVVVPVSAGPEGETPQDPPSGKDSVSSPPYADSEALAFERANGQESLNSGEELKADGPMPDDQASAAPMSFRDKIQQAACRLKSCETPDTESSSTLACNEPCPTSPSHPDNNLNASVLTSQDRRRVSMNLPPSLMNHVADQASKVVENLLRADTTNLQQMPAFAVEEANILNVYESAEVDPSVSDELTNRSNSMCRPECNDLDDTAASTSVNVTQVNAATQSIQDDMLMDSQHDHLQIGLENGGEELQLDVVHDLMQLDAGVSGEQLQVENDQIQVHRANTARCSCPNAHQHLCADTAHLKMVQEAIQADELGGADAEEDPSMVERIVGSAMVEALHLNAADLLDSAGANTEEVVQEVGSLILLADFGVDDDDEGALSDMSGCADHTDNSDLDDL